MRHVNIYFKAWLKICNSIKRINVQVIYKIKEENEKGRK